MNHTTRHMMIPIIKTSAPLFSAFPSLPLSMINVKLLLFYDTVMSCFVCMQRIDGLKKNGSSDICILLKMAISENRKSAKTFLKCSCQFQINTYILYMDLQLSAKHTLGQLSQRKLQESKWPQRCFKNCRNCFCPEGLNTIQRLILCFVVNLCYLESICLAG